MHGPGGIGKSALLGELTRRAATHGLTARSIDGRDPTAAQQGAQKLVAAAVADAGPSLVVVDAYEHIAALGALLRAGLAASVGAQVRLLIAGRRPPELGWLQGGWEHLLRTGHARTQEDLHMSRTTSYRRPRIAVARVFDQVLDARAD